MTSSAAEMGKSGVDPAQRQESTSKQTVDTEDRTVPNGHFALPGKAEHAQQDNGDTGEGTVNIIGEFPDDKDESEAAMQAAGQHMEQQKSAVLNSDVEAEPVSASGNGWSLTAPDTGPGTDVRESGSMGAAAEGPVREADSASAEPEADPESAAAPKRPRLSAKQRRMVLRQHAEMVRQVRALLAILQRQIKLAGKDPLAEEEVQQQQADVAAIVAAPEQRQAAAASSEGTALPVASSAVAIPAFTHKPGKLTPEAEAKLLIHFGLQDTLTREETQALAAQVGASEAAVRDHIGKLRGNMRAALQRLQRKAISGSPAAAPPRAHAHHATPGMQLGATHSQPTAPSGPTQPQSAIAASLGTAHGRPSGQPAAAHAQQPGSASQPMSAPGDAQGTPLRQSAVGAQHAPALPASSLATGNGIPPALDLSGLQAILKNAGLAQAAQALQTDAAKHSASAGAAAPQQGQTLQQSLSSATHSTAPGSSAAASASAGTKISSAQKQAGSILGATSPGAGAAALAAIDKACVHDTALLSSMLDTQRGIRHDCTGKLAGALIGMKTAEGRHETLMAMLRTTPAASLMPVALSHRCLDTLAEWTRWAILDRQTTILRLLQGVLLRLPIPPTMLHTGGLLRAVSSMQSYKVPSVSCGAINLLHHWQQQEPSLWPSAPKKQPGHMPGVAPAPVYKPQKQQQQPARQPPGAKPAAPDLHPSANGFSNTHSSTAAKQQATAPSRAFYRGVAGRMGAEQPAKSASAKPLTADEIVQAQLRKRQAGSALTKGVSGKVPRLDNKSMLEAASKRRQGPGRHGALGNGPNSPRMSLQHSKQPPTQTQLPQTHSGPQTPGIAALALGGLSAPSAAALQTIVWAAQGIAEIGSADPRQRGSGAARQPAQHGHGPALEPRSVVDWWQPPVVKVQYEADIEFGQGAGSSERQTQQMHRASQPEAVYALPELIPATPGEPGHTADERSHAPHSNPPRVPLLPTDPEEAQATYQWLHGLQLPQETIMGRPGPIAK